MLARSLLLQLVNIDHALEYTQKGARDDFEVRVRAWYLVLRCLCLCLCLQK